MKVVHNRSSLSGATRGTGQAVHGLARRVKSLVRIDISTALEIRHQAAGTSLLTWEAAHRLKVSRLTLKIMTYPGIGATGRNYFPTYVPMMNNCSPWDKRGAYPYNKEWEDSKIECAWQF